jgi:WD40 repeat protein
MFAYYVKELDMLYIVDIYSGDIIHRIESQTLGESWDSINEKLQLVWSPDGKTLAWYGEASGTVAFYDIDDEKIWSIASENGAMVSSFSFHPKRSQIAIFYSDRTLAIRDLESGATIDEVPVLVSTQNYWGYLLWSPDGSLLAFQGAPNQVWIYSISDKAIVQKLGFISGSTNRFFSFSPDGKRIAVNETIYNVADGYEEFTLPYSMVGLDSPMIWIDNRRIISEYNRETVCIWTISPLDDLIDEAKAQLSGRQRHTE